MTFSAHATDTLTGGRSPVSIRYRPDIDGMRAVAVIVVILFHNFPDKCPGGFIGVDIFFVLSGYLISAVILGGLRRREFSLAGFYARRIRRIFPALSLVLFSTLLVGWCILAPREWHQLAKDVLEGAGFVSNLLHPPGDGYFSPAHAEPLLHLWSLGIEEQFYLVWPLALIVVWKLAGDGQRGGRVLAGILLLAGVSFVYNIKMVRLNLDAAFFSPLTRMWELLAGATLAQIVMIRGEVKRRSTAELLCAAGVALVAVGLALVDEGKQIPGWWTLLPVAGTALMVGAGSEAWLHRRVLASRPFVALGLLSYPVYLWHWPLLAFFKIVRDSGFRLSPQAEAVAKLSFVMLALLLSWATYRLVEMPMRFSATRSSAFRVKLLIAGMAVVSAIAVLSARVIGPRLHSPAVRELERAKADVVWSGNWKMSPFRTLECPSSRSTRATILVGDSHMGQYVPRARAAIQANPQLVTAVFATSGMCPPLPGINVEMPGFRCPEFYGYWNSLARDSRFSTVAISAYWLGSGLGPGGWPKTFHGHRATAADLDEAWMGLATDLRALAADGKRVVLFDDNPMSGTFDPAAGFARIGLPGFFRLSGVSRQNVERDQEPATRRLQELQRRSGAEIIHVRDYLCDNSDCPALDTDGSPIYIDDSHLRASKAAKLAHYVDDVLKP